MSRKYFGTDGIRGRVGEVPMTPEFALKLGWAAGKVLGRKPGARVLIGKDTRRSGYLFESVLEAGFAAAGIEVDLLGPLPTPAVAWLTRELNAAAGVIISASHNPHHDNGVKFISAFGEKLSDEIEREIESWLERELVCVRPEQLGHVRRIDDAQSRYIEFCKSAYRGRSLAGLRLVVDCANGAAYRVAPAVFSGLGAAVTAIADHPDGLNINRNCGSTHLAALQEAVRKQGADAGIALDGDGDRCLMVDAQGRAVDGDEILFVIARQWLKSGELKQPVVGTLMSNLGLEQALAAEGVGFKRAKVGDRYVLERLQTTGGNLGGEASGHILCLTRTTTGDGIITALEVLAAMTAEGRSLAELVSGMNKYPQVLINVSVSSAAAPLLEKPLVKDAVALAGKRLGGRGRILLRPSGTEPLIRVMVEAQEQQETHEVAESIAEAVRAAAQQHQGEKS